MSPTRKQVRTKQAMRPNPDDVPAEQSEVTSTTGLTCGPGVGKFVFRIRQKHVAEHYGALIREKRYGTVKLDLLLRMIALSPQHAGERKPGFVLWEWSYGDLFDQIQPIPERRSTRDRSPRELRHLKRKWVIEHLAHLRELELVKSKSRQGGRPTILVLKDDGSGDPFDDPSGTPADDRYVTVQGSLIAAKVLRDWKAPELAAYFAALFAEFSDDRRDGRSPTAGTGRWWRSLAWFSHPTYQPTDRVRLPFSTSLLEDGVKALRDSDLISVEKIKTDPISNRALEAPRNLYRNRFTRYDNKVRKIQSK